MRIKHHPPVPGDKKIVEKFLWLPIRIKNETRWLENVSIQYEYIRYGTHDTNTDIVKRYDAWIPIKFIDI
jgi:hypothetical protein